MSITEGAGNRAPAPSACATKGIMKNLHRIALVASVVAVLGASAACGGGGSVSPTATVSAPSVGAPGTPLATATVAPATPTTAAGAPSATAAPQAATAPAAQPTVGPAPATEAPPSPPTPAAAEQSLTIVAKDVKFSPNALTARAGGVLHLTLDNRDAGVQHDIIVYDASGAVAGATDPATGPVRQTLTVTLGAPQRYAFKCSVHPQAMNGTLAAQ
jgi:plastocyanin